MGTVPGPLGAGMIGIPTTGVPGRPVPGEGGCGLRIGSPESGGMGIFGEGSGGTTGIGDGKAGTCGTVETDGTDGAPVGTVGSIGVGDGTVGVGTGLGVCNPPVGIICDPGETTPVLGGGIIPKPGRSGTGVADVDVGLSDCLA